MPAVSHGHHVVEGYDESDCDYFRVQREQIEELELWLFGVSDPRIGDGVTKYMQAHLFDKKPKEVGDPFLTPTVSPKFQQSFK